MSKDSIYFNKYLKYKNKYLQLQKHLGILKKQKGGEFIPYNLDQKTWHEILNRMNEEFVITGCGYIFQWHNENYSKDLPKTITLMGESHQGLRDFSPALNLPVGKRGHQKTYRTLNNTSLAGNVDELEDQTRFLVVELLWYMFKGTRRCLDFYLEDWKTRRGESFNIRWDDLYLNWDLNRLDNVTIEFTITNLERMLDHDIHIFNQNRLHPDLRSRKDIKKFTNIRAHYNEYRIPDIYYNVLLPYNNGSWFIQNENNVRTRIINFPGSTNRISSIKRFFNKLGDLFKLLSCINIDGGDLHRYLPYGEVPRNNFDEAYDELKTAFDTKYEEIKNEYTRYGYIRAAYMSTDREKEAIYYPLLKKVLKNLWDCDSKTQKKFIVFFNSVFNLSNIIDRMRINYTEFRIGRNNLDFFIESYILNVIANTKVWLVDIYSISRNIKTFSLKNQSNNLRETSDCFNNNDLSNRNVVCYDGYSHTFNYYFFYRFYYGSLPTMSICSENSNYPDFNEFFSNYIKYEDATSKLINKPLNEDTIENYCNQYWLFMFTKTEIDLNLNNITPENTFGKLFKRHLNDNKHFTQKGNLAGNLHYYQALPNKFNIIKRILINITKERNERNQLVKNIGYLNDISSIIKKLLDSNIQRNIISTTGWFHNYYLFDKLTDTNITSQRITFDLFNKEILLGVLAKGYYYKNDEFYQNTLANSKLRLINDALPENSINNDKIKINSILTDIVNDMFFDSFKNKLEFLKIVYNYIDKAYNKWCEYRYPFYTDGIYPAGGYPAGFRDFEARDTPEIRLEKIRNNMRILPIVKLLFKGGMTLRLLFFDLKKQFNIEVERKLLDKFGDYFKISDFDFETKINIPSINEEGLDPGIRDIRNDKFNKLYTELSLLNFIIIRDLTDIFNNNYFNSKLFKFNNMDYGIREAKLESYLIKLKELIPNFREYENIRNFSYLIAGNNITTPSENIYKLEQNYNKYNYQYHLPIANRIISNDDEIVETNKIITNTKSGTVLLESELPLEVARKEEFLEKINNNNPLRRRLGEILADIRESEKIRCFNLYELEKFYENFVDKLPFDDKAERTNINKKYNSGSFYQTWSSNIYTIDNRFSLTRIKYNFNLLGQYNDNTNFLMQNGGEVIDLSIADKSKSKLNVETKRFSFINSDFKYISYSLEGHIMDLFKILFFVTKTNNDLINLEIVLREIYGRDPTLNEINNIILSVPWRDKKFIKRIDRLLVLIFIQKMNQVNNINKVDNLNLIRRIFLRFKRCFTGELPENYQTDAVNLTRLINIRNKLLNLFNIDDFISSNRKLNSNVDGATITPTTTSDFIIYDNPEIIGVLVDADCPHIGENIHKKINHLADINGLITFIYLNIQFLNYYIYNLEQTPIRYKDIIFKLNETSDEFKIKEYFDNIINSIDNILDLVNTIKNDRYPEINEINPKNLN